MKEPNENHKDLLELLKERFGNNSHRHQGLKWPEIETRLKADPKKLSALMKMEQSGGEPDVVGYLQDSDQYFFVDCCTESPKGRRSLCYDRAAREARKKYPPESSAMEMAAELGVELLTESQYRDLQKLEVFDSKTSSWIQTPKDIREKGGALFCDYRYGKVFVYHNGADSYYASRGFRGTLKV